MDADPPALLAELPPSPAGHFKLHVLAAAFHVAEQAAASYPSPDALLDQFPFLSDYLADIPVPVERDPAFWPGLIRAFEARVSAHLPLRALRRAAALDHRAVMLLCAVGLIEEDARFGQLFDAMTDAAALHRPTLGLLNAWWREPVDAGEVRAALRRLRELGLVQVMNPEAPRVEWALHAPALLWDAVRGEVPAEPAPWLRHHPVGALPKLPALVLPEELRAPVARLPALLEAGEARALVVRGPRRNGRHTLIAAVAQALGRGVLEAAGLARADDERWRTLAVLSTLLRAVPVIALDPGPGETVEVPAPVVGASPLALVLGKHGGVSGGGVEGAVTLTLPMPERAARGRHWEAGLAGHACHEIDAVAERFRMTSGNIRRAAVLARAHAGLRGGDGAIGIDDVREAGRALHRQALDTLATRLDATGSFASLSVNEETARELAQLAARCRHREALHATGGAALRGQRNPGVRALFQGPSGTGKTLAARLLAAELAMDLYRVEISSVVSKYIGETEKNLAQIFALAEELDVVLLLDEGDSLLTQRTAVQTSNDRYANLETNYLLQRIESYEGLLVVTTNAGELIDGAFARRMDVVIDFRLPEASERLAIWRLHLPGEHAVDPGYLQEIAVRCSLTGGQIKNAVLHAALLALDAPKGGAARIGAEHVEAALLREYRKAAGVYPLKRRARAPGERA